MSESERKEARMGAEGIGTVIGTVADGDTLAGWEIVATGDGRAIVMKSGSCWGQWGGRKVETDLAWDAVTARLWARMTDAEVLADLEKCKAEVAAAKNGTLKLAGANAAARVTWREAA